MTIFDAILLGALQGATEFLPVSSDGHLVLAEHLLGLHSDPEQLLLFNLLVHLATTVAIVIAYREDIGNILTAAVGRGAPVKSPKFGLEMRDIWYTPQQARTILGWLILSTAVTGALYLTTKDCIDPYLTNVSVAGVGFLITSAAVGLGQRVGQGSLNIRETGWRRAILIGIAQYPAILPGVSRSGLTIGTGLLSGLGRLDAAKYSFLMAIPAIVSGFLIEAYQEREHLAAGDDLAAYLVGFFVAMAVGVWAIGLLQKMLAGKGLMPFVYYTAALGIVTLVLVATKTI